MKKWIIRIVIFTFVLVVIATIAVSIYLDTIVQRAAEYGTSYALGVDTTIRDLDVRPLSGRIRLDDLNIANPDGFDSPHFLALNSADVAVSVRSLTSDHVVIPNLTLSGIGVNLERKKKTANYTAILDNLKKFESDEPDQPAASNERHQRFTIQELVLEDIHVQADLTGLGQLTRVPIDIDRIYLTDVGSESDSGALAAQLTDVITKALLAGVAKKAGNLLPGAIGKELGKGLAQLTQVAGMTAQLAAQATKELGKAAEQIGQVGKDITEGVGKTVEGVAGGLDQVGKDLGKGIGGILKIGKDKEQPSDDD